MSVRLPPGAAAAAWPGSAFLGAAKVHGRRATTGEAP
jgi:hypothetical protein